jgi:hypothetical protein
MLSGKLLSQGMWSWLHNLCQSSILLSKGISDTITCKPIYIGTQRPMIYMLNDEIHIADFKISNSPYPLTNLNNLCNLICISWISHDTWSGHLNPAWDVRRILNFHYFLTFLLSTYSTWTFQRSVIFLLLEVTQLCMYLGNPIKTIYIFRLMPARVARFFQAYRNGGKIYQMTTNYARWP